MSDELNINRKAISFDQLKQEIGPALMRNINGFTTPLFFNRTHRGSAVLVTYRGIYGFLTAHHVIHEFPELALGGSRENLLQMKVKEVGHSFGFPLSRLIELPIGVPSNGRYTENGPDLTFVKLPKSEELRTLLSLKVFYNLEHSLGDPGNSANGQHCIISGFPDKLKTVGEWRNEEATVFREIFLFGGFDRDSYLADGDFDTMTVNIEKEEDTEKPNFFGGISGGSVWQFSIEASLDGEQARVRHPMLAGIVFYQKADEGENMPLVFHCRQSIEKTKLTIEASPWMSA